MSTNTERLFIAGLHEVDLVGIAPLSKDASYVRSLARRKVDLELFRQEKRDQRNNTRDEGGYRVFPGRKSTRRQHERILVPVAPVIGGIFPVRHQTSAGPRQSSRS